MNNYPVKKAGFFDEEEIDDVEKEVIDIDTPKKRKAEDEPQAKKAKVGAN